MMNRYVLPLIVVILFTSVNLSLAQSSAKEALEYYCKKKNIDTSICRSNILKVISLGDIHDSTLTFMDSLCKIALKRASLQGNGIYAIELHNDSQYNVVLVWYSSIHNKLYLISDINELEDWINDELTYKINRNVNNNQRSKWSKRKTAFRYINAQIYLDLMTYNCFYNQNLYIPSKVIKSKTRLRRHIAKHPMVFSISKN